MNIIETKKLTYDYPKEDGEGNTTGLLRALSDVTMEISVGSFIAIVGANGSGKSTLAMHLNALLHPTGGTVTVNGMDTSDTGHLWDIRGTVGMVFQNPDNQIISSIVEEDVAFGPENMGVPSQEIRQRVRASLEAVDMAANAKSVPGRLSGGQKQRVAIAGVLAMRPKCIVLDESTAMLDPMGRHEVMDTIIALNKKENITIILITHHMDEAVSADYIFVMDEGRIAMRGVPARIFADPERLKALKLDMPQVTELSYMLEKAGVPMPRPVLNIGEFAHALGKKRTLRTLCGIRRDDCHFSNIKQEDRPKKEDIHIEEPPRPILELRDVSYCYDKDTPFSAMALDRVSLSIHKGEFIGIIGRTGSGKSTLIEHMDGILRAGDGDVLYMGNSIYSGGYDMRKLRGRVGLVFQYPEHQLFEYDVFKDVCFGPKNQGLDQETCEARAREALHLVGVGEECFKRSPFELSGGQKRRVAIAGVIAMRPEILILDEPAAGLDPAGRDDILGQIYKMHRKTGMSVVLVSHSMEDVANYASRIVVLDNGRILLEGTPSKVFSNAAMLEEAGLSVPQTVKAAALLKEYGWNLEGDVTTVAKLYKKILAEVCHD